MFTDSGNEGVKLADPGGSMGKTRFLYDLTFGCICFSVISYAFRPVFIAILKLIL